MKKVKFILIFVTAIIFIFAFSGSYNSNNIDNLAYVVAIGIDTSETDKMKVSFQFMSNLAMSNNSKSSSDDTTPIVNTVECSSIDTAINLMNIYIGKKLNISHCKVIVISEDFAKSGISSTIYSLINDTQLRPSTNLIISRCESNYYIKNSKPSLETLVTRYYDIFPNSSKYTGYTSNVTIGEFFNSMICDSCQSTAILGGKNIKENQNTSFDNSSTIAEESSITGKRGTENIGLAVFNSDKLVGELNAIETLCHLLIKNQVETFMISVPNPNGSTKSIDLSLYPQKQTSISVDVSNGTPFISLNIELNGTVITIDDNANYLDQNNLNVISDYTNSYLESAISDYLYKTSKEFKSDIDSFGKSALKEFITENDWNKYDWLNVYKDAFFSVNVKTNIQSSQLLNQT